MNVVCTTSAALGKCGPYDDTEVTDNGGGNSNVQNDVWNPIAGWSQTLHVISEGRWWATVNIPPNTSVVSYPDTDILFSNWGGGANPSIDSFSYINSAVVTSVPSGNTALDSGWDIWMNGYKYEMMIQNQMVGRLPCTRYTTVLALNVNFPSVNGTTDSNWNLCRNGGPGSELIWQWVPPDSNSQNFGVSSLSVDIYNMLKYVEKYGYLPSGATLTAIQYGFEIGSTNSTTEDFYLDAFSLNTSGDLVASGVNNSRAQGCAAAGRVK
jgi:hypothetical protein